jgi:anti-anti-sigma regulatory factor
MDNSLHIQLSKYSQNLGSRMLGKQVLDDINGQIGANSKIVLDFKAVRFMSLSFATELIDNLQQQFKEEDIIFIEANSFINSQINFILKTNKQSAALLSLC